jgi:hypothetical protein
MFQDREPEIRYPSGSELRADRVGRGTLVPLLPCCVLEAYIGHVEQGTFVDCYLGSEDSNTRQTGQPSLIQILSHCGVGRAIPVK